MRVESGLSPGYKLQTLGGIWNDIHQKESIELITLRAWPSCLSLVVNRYTARGFLSFSSVGL